LPERKTRLLFNTKVIVSQKTNWANAKKNGTRNAMVRIGVPDRDGQHKQGCGNWEMTTRTGGVKAKLEGDHLRETNQTTEKKTKGGKQVLSIGGTKKMGWLLEKVLGTPIRGPAGMKVGSCWPDFGPKPRKEKGVQGLPLTHGTTGLPEGGGEKGVHGEHH